MPQSGIAARAKQSPNTPTTGIGSRATPMVVIHTQATGDPTGFTPRVGEPAVSNFWRHTVSGPTSMLFTTSVAPRLRQRGAIGHETRTRISLGVLAPGAEFLKWFTGPLLRCMTFTVPLAFVRSVTAGEGAGFKRYEHSLVWRTPPGVSRPILTPQLQTPTDGHLLHCRCSAFRIVPPTQTPSMHLVFAQLHLAESRRVFYSIFAYRSQGGVSTFLCVVGRTETFGILHPITGIKIALFAHPTSVPHFGFFGESSMRSPHWVLGWVTASESGFRRSAHLGKRLPFPSCLTSTPPTTPARPSPVLTHWAGPSHLALCPHSD